MHTVLLIVGLLASAAFGHGSDKVAIAPRLTSTMHLDGQLEDWNPGIDAVAPVTPVGGTTSFVEQGEVRDDSDLSAAVYMGRDDHALWIGGYVVDDDVLSQFHNGDIWQGDMAEFLIELPKGYLHVGVAPNGEHHVFEAGGQPAKILEQFDQAIESAAVVGPPGYRFELRIPFEVLGWKKVPNSIRFNIALKDADDDKKTQAHVTWSGQRHQTVHTFGTLLLPPPVPPIPPNVLHCAVKPPIVELNKPLTVNGTQLMSGETSVRLRMVNFQSASANWIPFWTDRYDLQKIKSDLDRAVSLKANSIRIFVFWEVFGGATPEAPMLEKLRAVIDAASERGLLSVVTFFPFKKEFRPEWWPDMESHLVRTVSYFRGHPGIAMWDLMNEPDHAWALAPDGGVTAQMVSEWSEHMVKAVKDADPTHLVTIGQVGHFAFKEGPVDPFESLPFVDVASIHGYASTDEVVHAVNKAIDVLHKPVILQEYGLTSLYVSEDDAATQYRSLCKALDTAAIPVAGIGAWELFDHPTFSIAHQNPVWREGEENHFGLLRVDGSAKKQADAFCQCLNGVPSFKIHQTLENLRE